MILAAVGIAIEIGLISYLAIHASRDVMSTPAFVIAVLLPFSPVIFRRGLRSQKALLQNGEVAIATVTHTSRPGRDNLLTARQGQVNENDDVRTVQYRFLDSSGASVEGTCADGTLMLQVNSAMLIFYELDNPANQVTQCTSYYRVVAPGLDDDWLDNA